MTKDEAERLHIKGLIARRVVPSPPQDPGEYSREVAECELALEVEATLDRNLSAIDAGNAVAAVITPKEDKS